MFTLTSVGRVESTLKDRKDAPRQGTEGAPPARLVFDAAFEEALRDLQPGDEVLVLTWLHRADRSVLRVHPRDETHQPMRGVFSTRSPDRPNPIGLHRVRIVSKEGPTRVDVDHLEAIDGTPVIDIKPVLDSALER